MYHRSKQHRGWERQRDTMRPHQTHTRQAAFDPTPKLVLFDLDDTLCDYDTALHTRIRYAFEPWFPSPDELAAAVRAQVELADWEGGEHFSSVFARFGVSDPDAARLARERFLEDRYRGLRLFDDALDVITAVASHVPIGMITNGPSDIQWPKIRLLDIEHLFPVIIVSEDVGVWKPDPAIFTIALERSGFAAHEAIYVGDSVVADVPGARAAGIRSVWMNRARRTWSDGDPPDAVIHSLHDLLPLLGIAAGRRR